MINIQQTISTFKALYGEGPVRVFQAPARVNLIGEHIDYNGGLVFPAALTLMTVVVARPRQDGIIAVAADTLPGIKVECPLGLLGYMKGRSYGAYQLGVADELLKAGYQLVGADLLYTTDIPFGSGLSSSASIEVATAVTLATLGMEAHGQPVKLDMKELAVIGQRAENKFVGVNCGIMDQFASANGKQDHAVLLDCATLDFQHVPLVLGDYRIVITNTNKPHNLIESKYNQRRSECEQGLAMLQGVLPDLKFLCELTPDELVKHQGVITDPVVLQRVTHVVGEQDRVLKAVNALKANDLVLMGQLMTASHTSLRDDYEVTGIELDTLNAAALKVEGVLGSRMTGAGFGGCIVSLVHKDALDTFKTQVEAEYYQAIGYHATCYVSAVGAGAGEYVWQP